MKEYLRKLVELTKEAQDTRSKLEREIEERLEIDVDRVYATVSKIFDDDKNEGVCVITLSNAEGNCRSFVDLSDNKVIGIKDSVERIFGITKIQFGCEDKMNEVQKYRIGKLEDRFEQNTGCAIGIRYVEGRFCKDLDNKYEANGINLQHSYLEFRFKVDTTIGY